MPKLKNPPLLLSNETLVSGGRMASGRPWSSREHALLRRLWAKKPTAELVPIFKRSPQSIKSRATVLHLKKGNRQCWTPAEDPRLRKLYPRAPMRTLVRVFRRTPGKIYARADRLGITRDADIKKAIQRECGRQIANHPYAIASRFPKGHVPANKGLRRPGYSAGRMKETQFKKGERSGAAQAKWCPVGTVKFNTDGYLRRKIADEPEAIAGKGGQSTNWEFVHIRVWEDAHGPIPKGYRIWWKDGDHGNCALENLELLSGKEHMARTTVQNLPPSLKQVIQLNGALKRRIRRLSREKEQHPGFARPSLRDAGGASGSRQAARC